MDNQIEMLDSNDVGKRRRDDSHDDGGSSRMKIARLSEEAMAADIRPQKPLLSIKAPTLKPEPYFYYRDFSRLPDPDPLTPLTAPGRVPNFPAKMHSILSRPDLADIVAWMPHGRSWRVLKPREFEVRVIPKYFEHSKFSSFIRQANGWGFRRITQGRDRNSYYHELFLRGLPHLCKQMRRPGAYEKQTTDPEHEPDFYKISMERPVPDKSANESILLNSTLQAGPKARMPVYLGSMQSITNSACSVLSGVPQTYQNGLSQQQPGYFSQQARYGNPLMQVNVVPSVLSPMSQQELLAKQTGLRSLTYSASTNPILPTQNNIGSLLHPAPASQFAAGFAAATALSQQQFASILGQAMASYGSAQPRGHQ